LVLGLFLFQDERMSGLITSVKTPILSVDLNKLSDSDKLINLTESESRIRHTSRFR